RFLVVWTREDRFDSSIVGLLLTACGDGVAEAGEECDDGNLRDGDCCSPTCHLSPIAGQCWRVATASLLHFSATPTIQGIPAICTARCWTKSHGVMMLLDDGTYRIPQGTVQCRNGESQDLPDEIGRQHHGGKATVLRPDNLADLRAALHDC